ncbi:MAG TPA: helix-turn-helix transcriptional regulator [Candidatus Ozemobacteraceae bacterium]|nr:helix-turn-helix transcriptional regulator [Candidatus Ozemobacteraceae bacterium]
MLTDWLEVLREACKAPSSQADIARRLGVSRTMISLALQGRYEGNLGRLESLVRGTFMAETVDCPVMGIISRRTCLDEQARPFASTNPQRVLVWRTCRKCSRKEAAATGGNNAGA